MISFGFSARHWQQIEAGCPITLTTLLRICEVLDVRLTTILGKARSKLAVWSCKAASAYTRMKNANLTGWVG